MAAHIETDHSTSVRATKTCHGSTPGPPWFRPVSHEPRSLGTRWQGLETEKSSDVRAALDHRLSEVESLVGTVACCMLVVEKQTSAGVLSDCHFELCPNETSP